MASTKLGDIPGARFFFPEVAHHGSFASDRGNSVLGQIGPLLHNIRVQSVWWIPAAADNDAANANSYRRLSLYNGGTAGTVTATASRIASANLTASVASRGAQALTVTTSVTAASGAILYFSQETVGGAHSTGTVLRAGQFAVAYEVI